MGLRELVTLLNYAKAASVDPKIGEMNDRPHDTLVAELNVQSDIKITVEQLEHLLYVYKTCIAEQVAPGQERADTNWNQLMERLSKVDSRVYKVTANGEVKLYEFGS